MEKGEMYFRIIEDGYVREDNGTNRQKKRSHVSLETKQSLLFKSFQGPKICQCITF